MAPSNEVVWRLCLYCLGHAQELYARGVSMYGRRDYAVALNVSTMLLLLLILLLLCCCLSCTLLQRRLTSLMQVLSRCAAALPAPEVFRHASDLRAYDGIRERVCDARCAIVHKDPCC